MNYGLFADESFIALVGGTDSPAVQRHIETILAAGYAVSHDNTRPTSGPSTEGVEYSRVIDFQSARDISRGEYPDSVPFLNSIYATFRLSVYPLVNLDGDNG